MNHIKFEFQIENQKDIVMALCSDLPFTGFEENETGFIAYLPESEPEQVITQQIQDWSTLYNYTFVKSLLAAKNWNAEWESNFRPISIGSFCAIRADFHPPIENVAHEIIITPKMAFGTGHHQTTYMMIECMQNLDLYDKKVFDFGCGTGILSILAERLGAQQVLAIDIEHAAFENTQENLTINRSERIICSQGELKDLASSERFDIILANINRHVILDSLQSLFHRLETGGHLLISGFLTQDEPIMKKAINKYGFILACVKKKDNWLCFHLSSNKK